MQLPAPLEKRIKRYTSEELVNVFNICQKMIDSINVIFCLTRVHSVDGFID
jgi:hypothetical protein